ncbi:hypothetical protein CMI37_02085 [Candidatus Pacearchaeota archaeon]|nr:hypothetical protein [Candidatus Pacearchaeota archaeon]
MYIIILAGKELARKMPPARPKSLICNDLRIFLKKLLTIVPPALARRAFVCYIIVMKARNIINANNEDSAETFAVSQHIITRNFWEYYLEEADENGHAFGYVMGIENEWGMVDMAEIKPYIISKTSGTGLNEIMAPAGYYWEDEKKVLENEEKSLTGV